MEKLSRRNFLKTAIGGVVAASTFRCDLFKAKERPMNVLYIMTDQ